jgi:hypothetical protein
LPRWGRCWAEPAPTERAIKDDTNTGSSRRLSGGAGIVYSLRGDGGGDQAGDQDLEMAAFYDCVSARVIVFVGNHCLPGGEITVGKS